MILESELPFGDGGLVARKLRLENGLGAILLRDPSAPLVAVQTWFRVGSRHERPGKTGLAHLFEHLMFNQTEHLAPGEFDRRLEAVGADSNAATWVDWTYYRENAPREHLDLVLGLEADRMGHLVVEEPQVESEREVVKNERRQRVEDDVDGFLDEELHRLAFTVHPYRWPTIGWMEDIAGFTTLDARQFYRTFYAPSNATLVVVGDFDPPRLEERIAHHYGPLAATTPPSVETPEEPPQTEPRRALFGRPVAAPRLAVAWRAVGLDHPDHPALEVAQQILTSGHSSRLYRQLVDRREMASSVSGAVPEFRDPGLFQLWVALKRRQPVAEVEAVIAEEVAALAEVGPAEAELEKAKAKLETRRYRELRPQEGKAEALGHFETTIGDYRKLFSLAAAVATVSAAQVREAVARYLAPAKQIVVVAEPGGRSR